MGKTLHVACSEKAAERQAAFKTLDRNVKVLGVVSLLNDLSSEVAVRTLPLFLANVLGVKTGIIGFIEGIAESTATLLKIASGYLADRLEKKKALTLPFFFGGALACLSSLLLLLIPGKKVRG